LNLIEGLVVAVGDPEELCADISAFFLRLIKFLRQAIRLSLPIANDFVELPDLLLHLVVLDVGMIQMSAHLLNLVLKGFRIQYLITK